MFPFLLLPEEPEAALSPSWAGSWTPSQGGPAGLSPGPSEVIHDPIVFKNEKISSSSMID